MREEQDELIGRVVRELEVLPRVQPGATERVLARIAAQRNAGGEIAAPLSAAAPPHESAVVPIATRRRRAISLPWALSLAVAATVAGFLVRGVSFGRHDTLAPQVAVDARSTPGVAVVPATAAASRARDEAAVETQFVLARARAEHVALVGDFNDWDPRRTPMARHDGDLWSVTLPLTPGRHAYAFVVNDTVWTLDPRAAQERDADYGRAQSVIVVGRP